MPFCRMSRTLLVQMNGLGGGVVVGVKCMTMREPIVKDDTDWARFLDVVGQALERFDARAWAGRALSNSLLRASSSRPQ